MDIIRMFIGYDHAENVAHNVMVNSIQRHASRPVAITQVALHQLKDVLWRERHPLQSNEFTFSRWLVPYLCNYKGWAIWADCDMLFFDDVAKLWAQRNPKYAVQVVKHKHKPREDVKYLGNKQTQYDRKNWSSVIMFNCEKCRKLTPGVVNKADGLYLHQFRWLEDTQIGDLPPEWNYLVGYQKQTDLDEPVKNAHFTIGGPYFKDYRATEFAQEWWAEYWDMVHCLDPAQAPEKGYTSLDEARGAIASS